ncbi:MAG TPA: VCBS repeat-containing protein, partial [Hanamia sp.]|nr:VCBS repeat-containing protein [Hanamia sp.]
MKKNSFFTILIIILFTVSITGFSIFTETGKKAPLYKNDPTGEELAKIYCATCHIFPSPSLLDKLTWEKSVLPNMGWRLGIREPGDNPYGDMEKDEIQIVQAENIYPLQPGITKENWQKIVNYYIKTAPEKPLPQKGALPFENELKGFHAEEVFIGKKITPKTCMIKFDTASSLLYIGDASNELYAINQDLQVSASWKVESPPVDVDFPEPGIPRVLCIGSISPSEKKTGSLYILDSGATASYKQIKEFEKLARPVQFAEADLNSDGKKDLIICQFGNHTGKLSWFDGGDPEKEHVLLLQAGARKVEVRDFNGDGKPDIIALMAQAREELVLFLNEGNGQFTEKILYQFPPVYGVSYFELADFNHDGHPDILMTNGDNWDISPIRKYYHGIRILMNAGMNNFKEKLFIPFYGASKAMAYDFDGDGDLDIAAISFYDDPDKPEQSFMYLENKGNLKFTASTTKMAAKGKWLTMDIGDFDKDGDTDIFLGSYIYSMSELTKLLYKGIVSFPQAIILINDKNK